MPDFEPTQYMFDTFRQPGEEDWEVYGRVLRLAMAKEGEMEICDMSYKEKVQYEKFMQMKAQSPYLTENVEMIQSERAEPINAGLSDDVLTIQ